MCSYELAHGDSIWGAIDSLVSAAAASRKDKKAAAGSLEKAMAAFTSTVGKKLHEIDTTDKVAESDSSQLRALSHAALLAELKKSSKRLPCGTGPAVWPWDF